VRARDDVVFAWRAMTPSDIEDGATARAWLDVFAPAGDGSHRRHGAEQVQCHHPEEVVTRAIADAGLELAALLGQGDDGHPEAPLDPARHAKAVWVVRRR
jgi:hypothetical protein